MPKLVIKRPNGGIENVNLRKDKPSQGSKFITVVKDGKPYYVQLGSNPSTHLFVIYPNGTKLYAQNAIEATASLDFLYWYEDDPSLFNFRFNFNKGSSDFGGGLSLLYIEGEERTDKLMLSLYNKWSGIITIKLDGQTLAFEFSKSRTAYKYASHQWFERLRKNAARRTYTATIQIDAK